MTVLVEAWYDEDAGPLVRLYARTAARTPAPREDLEVNTIIYASPGATAPAAAHEAVLRLCRQPVALSEISAHLALPLGETRQLIGELRAAGLVTVRRANRDNGAPGVVLQRLLSGLRSL